MHTNDTRRRFIGRTLLAGLGLAGLAAAPMASAADYPDKPIQLIVPYGAGGPTDALLRTLATQASQQLGQSIVIENRPGANGTFGAAMLARARDSHTIAVIPATVFREPFLAKVPYDPLKLTYIIGLTDYVFGLAVRQDAPWQSWQELAEDAARRPGRISVGMAGATGTARIVLGEIADAKQLDFNFIPYKGDSELTTDLLGGHVDAAAMTGTAVQYISSGRMRYLAMLTAERAELFPDVPTFRDLGVEAWVDSPFGLAGPADMPPAHVQRIHDAFKAALESPQGRQALASLNQPLNYMAPQAYADYARQAIEREKGRVEYLRAQGLVN
ncbi:tripartite tricarboxylate transporter substrate binding protein [Corticibacter populi]|uniref:Tripartite tricarboxylate transporter substrate binding protein n=1 Tax=Corticibacter populi TaxID=1550736 RepID=A0A3M6QMU0_9BURK|nr:tripartite tricarboxylate transporter substrate binding protein [Corticibacter populi]RMX04285.1 tripartite tricarboxylate transporter substrate binding protein [Corticibacter populi]RZS33332.1 tripartite-type tricarboxylate transporter receptor subunit TctC [Corticibacter populi]